ncbi:MAG: protein kinase domain-containing protein [Planctomycetota bacterium]|jgi:formylglycine-generating enzyme required for sulfatase activity
MPESPTDREAPTGGGEPRSTGRDTEAPADGREAAAEDGAALVRLGVRFGFLTPEAGEKALAAWEAEDRVRSMGDVLLENRILGEEDLEMLSQILALGSSANLEAVQSPSNHPAPGTRLGEFRILRQIARGSMGVVYEAMQEGLSRPVALKVLPSELTRDERTIERFQREAGAAASLSHPGIVKVLSVGEEEGFHYYAMDMVRGKALDAILETERLPHRRAGEIIQDAAVALAYAHEKGVIHRDIKPGNIMVTYDGQVLIADFGLARTDTTGTLTRSDEIVGTPMYMSPEQAAGDREKIDARTDIYSLGATLYEALTLSAPFEGTDLHHILSQVIGRDPRPPRSVNTLIPRDLEIVCMKAMEKEPEGRYRSAQAFADDLGRFLRGDTIHARPPSVLSKLLRKARRNKPAAGLVLLLLLVSAGIAGIVLGQFIRDREKVRSAADAASMRQAEGDEAFAAKMEAMGALEELEAKIGRVQSSREKAELLKRIDRHGRIEEECYGPALAAWNRILEIDPENRRAHESIARIHLHRARAGFRLAKREAPFREGSFDAVERELAAMGKHDPVGSFRLQVASMHEYIARTGTLDVNSQPQGAEVSLARVNRAEDFQPGTPERLGWTPLIKKGVKPGSYILTLTREGFAPIRLPVLVTREHPNPVLGEVELYREGELPPDLAPVPGGEFFFGGRVAGAARGDRRNLPTFFLGIHEVTYEEYLRFLNEKVKESGALWTLDPLLPKKWGIEFGYDWDNIRFKPPPGWEKYRNLPVWGIPLGGAQQFCDWKKEVSLREARARGRERYLEYRLPSEAEWEKGARGADGRLYPWGDRFDEGLCNNAQTKKPPEGESPVVPAGSFPGGASPYGVQDLAGNVAEWTSTEDPSGRDVIVKGGDLNSEPPTLQCPARRRESKSSRRLVGFRVVAEFKPVRPR